MLEKSTGFLLVGRLRSVQGRGAFVAYLPWVPGHDRTVGQGPEGFALGALAG